MNIGQFVAFGLGIVGGIVAAVGADWLRRFIYRPKIEILEDKPEKGKLFSCHAIEVTNTGRSVATNCHAIVTFEDLEEGDLIPEKQITKTKALGLGLEKFGLKREEIYLLKPGESFRPIENEFLSWSSVGNPLQAHIFPGTSRMVDVCRFVKVDLDQIQIPSENGWRSMRVAVQKKCYKMKLRIAAENVKPTEANFTIQPLGDYIELKKIE